VGGLSSRFQGGGCDFAPRLPGAAFSSAVHCALAIGNDGVFVRFSAISNQQGRGGGGYVYIHKRAAEHTRVEYRTSMLLLAQFWVYGL
jgi:hypothetical protein